jgi:hypothetical protein
MNAFKFAAKIISTLALDPLLPAYSAITFALAEKSQGLLCAYGNSSGQLVVPNGIVAPVGSTLALGSATFAGAILSNTPTGGVGYSAGAGAAATQSTNKSTAVANTSSVPSLSGTIAMNNAALAAGTIVSFTFTNSAIAATDVLVLNHVSGGTVGSYTLNAQAGAGSAVINVRNDTAGSLSEAIVIQYAVIKGAVS